MAYWKLWTTTVAGLCGSLLGPWWMPVSVRKEAQPMELAPRMSALGLSPTMKKQPSPKRYLI